MKKIVLKSALVVGCFAFAMHAYGQQNKSLNSGLTNVIQVKKGSFFYRAGGNVMSPKEVEANLPQMMGLSSKYSFTKLSEKTDDLGFLQLSYQQNYDGVKVDNGMVLVHAKDGLVRSINGNVATQINVRVSPSITELVAKANAKKSLQVKKTIREYPVELVIAKSDAGDYQLAYKVRVDGKQAKGRIVMKEVFVNALTGAVIKQVELICDIDKVGMGQTYYSGAQIITVDSGSFGTRLRDSTRNIITYDVAGTDVDGDSSSFFYAPRDYYNPSTNWAAGPNLTNITLTTCPASKLAMFAADSNAIDIEGMVKRNAGGSFFPISWAEDITATLTPTLPIEANRMFIFPKDTLDQGGFGSLIPVNDHYDFAHAVYFPVNNLTSGTHTWSDNAGSSGSYNIKITSNPAVDAHWGMEKTHDFYSKVLGRNSYDDQGSVVRNYINGCWATSGQQNNASALPPPYNAMVYGMGDGEDYDVFVCLDVMGHEFTHMVTRNNGHGGLTYQGEPGALNESFSDIFGTSIEFYTKGAAANWLIGEDLSITAPALRSMSDPKKYHNPDTYLGQYWASTLGNTDATDHGGVHYNSGVQNKWFYLLSVGGSGINDNGDTYVVKGIGIEKARAIAYRNLTHYLTKEAQYIDAYEGSIDATIDLFGPSLSRQEIISVKNAWYAVGIGEQDTTKATAVTNVSVTDGDLKLYPNPASAKINIESLINEPLDAEIINIVGVPVRKITIRKGVNAVDISGLAKGVYMVKYDTGAKGFVQKFTVL